MEGRSVNDCWKTPCPLDVTFEVNGRLACDDHVAELMRAATPMVRAGDMLIPHRALSIVPIRAA